LSKVLGDENYLEANAEEDEDDDHDLKRANDKGEEDKGFWESLELLQYENKT